jgi:mRNA-degrading endonuclease toxin of MazEF toxin-antitoxin module
MNIEEFNDWNRIKKNLQISRPGARLYNERDVWWCSLGKNSLFERPVLILKKFNNQIAWVLPVTTKMKISRYHFFLEKESVLLSQLRLISVKRFNRYVKRVSMYDFAMIRERIIELVKYD